VEEVSGLPQFDCKLTWRELVSADEIRAWVVGGKTPKRLGSRRVHSELADPGVYRFIFPEEVDKNSSHTPCYVGEGGNLGERLRDHFSLRGVQEKRKKGELVDYSGWQVRGSIQNSRGEFSLQVLKIEDSISLLGVRLNQHSFDDLFARRLLENWAILYSEQIEHLYPLNRAISQGIRDLHLMMKDASTGSHSNSTMED
jgi:hypothetical protein